MHLVRYWFSKICRWSVWPCLKLWVEALMNNAGQCFRTHPLFVDRPWYTTTRSDWERSPGKVAQCHLHRTKVALGSCFRIIWAPFLWHYKDCQCPIVMLYYTPEMCSVWLFLQSNSIVFKFSCCLGLNNWWQFFNWMFSTFRSSRKTWQLYEQDYFGVMRIATY